MTIVWPEAITRLRQQGDHWHRRLTRIEAVATDGERINHEEFPVWRSYIEGKAHAYDEVFAILEGHRPTGSIPFDMTVVLLAQNGLDPEAIASRCGVSLYAVAESLARFAATAIEPKGDL